MGAWLRTGEITVQGNLSGRRGVLPSHTFHTLLRSLVLLALASLCSLCTTSNALLVASDAQAQHRSNTASKSASKSQPPQPKPSPGARRKRRDNPPPPVPSHTSLSKRLEREGLLTWTEGHAKEDDSLQQRKLFQVAPNALSAADASTAEGLEARGLRMAFYDRLDSTRTESEKDYVMNVLMQATASVLARSIRVRYPSGLLDIVGDLDYYGEEIPGDPEGIDADIVIKVHSLPIDHPECEGTEALAWHELNEAGTNRPIFGTIQFCNVDVDDQEADLSNAVHEVIHALGFNPSLFSTFLGYENTEDDIIAVDSSGATYIKTPNVVEVVREHFDCADMQGAPLENFGGQGTAGGHWEERLFAGEMMDPMGGSRLSHHDRHVLTDLTVALLHDTGWYDVKYGAAGFNSYGYKAGCAFATGTGQEALASAGGARYLCDNTGLSANDIQFACLHDRSGVGFCFGSITSDDFNSTVPWDTSGRLDCMAADRDRGLRCAAAEEDSDDYTDHSQCLPMQCATSAAGGAPQVLVNGEPCDPQVMDCPDDVYMCEDPGLLLCVGELNDCSGVGDCYKGACYCHGGWGGADCSVPACLSTVGCDDGTPCPASGFCGVEECGTWSNGHGNRGVPCDGALGPTPTPPSPCESNCEAPGAEPPSSGGLGALFGSAAGGAVSKAPVVTAALTACLLLILGTVR